jgi:hypothetical protein
MTDHHTISDSQQWLHDRIVERLTETRPSTREDFQLAVSGVLAEGEKLGHLVESGCTVERINGREPARPDMSNLSECPEIEGYMGWSRFAMWHPQWGGYGSPCVVEFDGDRGEQRSVMEREAGPPYDLPCFDVYEWHDGEFPTEECQGARHYCMAEQVVEFGLNVIELQVEHSTVPVNVSRERLEKWRARVDALLAKHEEQGP